MVVNQEIGKAASAVALGVEKIALADDSRQICFLHGQRGAVQRQRRQSRRQLLIRTRQSGFHGFLFNDGLQRNNPGIVVGIDYIFLQPFSQGVVNGITFIHAHGFSLCFDGIVNQLLGGVNTGQHPGKLDAALHQAEGGRFFPGIDEEIIKSFLGAFDSFPAPPAFKDAEGFRRDKLPVNGRGDVGGKADLLE